MKTLAAVLLLVATVAHAEDSRLVEAAKASGGANKKKTTKVITNDDVKKSTGKLTELPGSGAAETQKGPGQPKKSTIEKHDEKLRTAEASAKRIADAEKKVKTLERELAKIEQSYYESNDPDYRDKTIKAQFADTKRALEAARKELNDAKAAAPPKTP